MEDTCILMPGVDYADVRQEVRNCRAGVFGYGNRWFDKGKVGWHGTKAVDMCPCWCEEMSILLANTHLYKFQPADMWRNNLIRCGRAQGFKLLTELGGFGHRISLTKSTDQKRWGGAWLPHRPHARPFSPEAIDALALEYAHPEVQA